MRVLIEQECAAVAGGHESECEESLKTALIVGGALMGAGFGGPGGALIGASAGALAADAFGPDLCSMGRTEDEEEEQDGTDDPELDALFMQQYVKWLQNLGFGDSFGPNTTGPHQLIVEQSY